MNVYDFDGTIYQKDSSVEFYKFIIRKNPFIFYKCASRQLLAFIKYMLKTTSKEELKSDFFSFLKYIDVDQFLDEFVSSEMKYINQWYLSQHAKDDVIISASPAFLVNSFADKLNVKNVIASLVDRRTGKFYSMNCYGEEKVKRFKQLYPLQSIECFYTDSKKDLPMARLATHAFLVKKNIPKLWKQ